jgi:hypothetical protein
LTDNPTKPISTGRRTLRLLRALLLRVIILVVGLGISWPFISRYAISHGINAVIAYYWIIGLVVGLMIVHWLVTQIRKRGQS